jgi:hypothetical protein
MLSALKANGLGLPDVSEHHHPGMNEYASPHERPGPSYGSGCNCAVVVVDDARAGPWEERSAGHPFSINAGIFIAMLADRC